MADDFEGLTDLFGLPLLDPRAKRGRKTHRWMAQVSEIVVILKATGATQEEIADHVNLDAKTLRKHYSRELDRGIDTVRRAALLKLWRQGEKSSSALKAFLAELQRDEAREVAYRPRAQAAAPAAPKIGVKAERQAAAEGMAQGRLAPGAPPARLN